MLPNTISLHDEMVSYESLWGMRDWTLKKIAELFQHHRVLPTRLFEILAGEALVKDVILDVRDQVRSFISNLRGFTVSVNGAYQYPERLRAAKYPIELFYYRGDISFVESRCVSIVGARNCTA